jgi:hypothetical protein
MRLIFAVPVLANTRFSPYDVIICYHVNIAHDIRPQRMTTVERDVGRRLILDGVTNILQQSIKIKRITIRGLLLLFS